jgi:four helix bundle protein
MGREFYELEVWKSAQAAAVRVYREILSQLPTEEKYGLAAQLRRAAQSVPAKIAEAHGRYHYLDAIRFCYIARGSLEETMSHLLLAHELGNVSDTVHTRMQESWKQCLRHLNGYVRYLRHTRVGEPISDRRSLITPEGNPRP